ncbi:MAG TPA: hypothetical protein VMX12_02750 [Acidimicrobiia bacterium]|nr:hypothetical protein [Acidimicrobiia bacterium]
MAAPPDAHDPVDALNQADDDVGDELPSELDVTALVGPYLFPDIRRRRIAGAILVVVGGSAALGGLLSGNTALVVTGAGLLALAAYHFLAAWPLAVDQTEALAVASRTAGFPVGHASAQLGWRGLRSRPSWRVLLYSADDPPSDRGLVELDAVDATVLGSYTEPNPEDWSKYGLGATSGAESG